MKLHCGSFRLDLSRPHVMGIINVTPDSFSDGGRYVQRDAALAHAQQLLAEGADLLDIGGESTRPGAQPVGVQEEMDRVLPVLEDLRGAPVPLSIDTRRAEVMRAALAAGASLVNDVAALREPGALEAVASSGAAVCLMHMQGQPQTMQAQAEYRDVVSEVRAFLAARIAAAGAAGVSRERIVADPGFGFGKSLGHNLVLLRDLAAFRELGVPILAGLSRKSMLGALTGQDAEHRLPASLAAALIAVQKGASIVRVHDVRATVDALKILRAVNEAGEQ
ncbi:MAG TPA: dihydropteroate synthase [Gallionellaceae bacterium]|nr:dihydropteroate synthase [Gallionellaceae bacterium]